MKTNTVNFSNKFQQDVDLTGILNEQQIDENFKNKQTSDILVASMFEDKSTKLPLGPESKEDSSLMLEKQNKTKSWFEKINEFEANISSFDYSKNEIIAVSTGSSKIFSFSYDDIDPKDISKVKLGAPIVIVYGKEIICGSQYNMSRIYFRLEQNWLKSEIDSANEEANKLIAALK